MLLVTGGAGFIGANFVHDWLAVGDEPIVNLDKLTYAGNLQSLAEPLKNPRHHFVRADIGDGPAVSQVLAKYRPRAVINFAAESHVDRSIHDPDVFVQTNVLGTLRLLKTCLAYWSGLPQAERSRFRFVQVSTDEVYGSLGAGDAPFGERHPYRPNSPYAASKAAADHLVRSFHETYGLPIVTTNCSNNYGPYQFPEKLIPLAIHNALSGQPIPIYGDGQQIRDWLFVSDHCAALRSCLEQGRPGETYNIGATSERTNLTVVTLVCDILDGMRPRAGGASYRQQITFVKDRPGHDRRYAIDPTKIGTELGWSPQETFESGLRRTVRWYLDHQDWVSNVTTGAYRDWIALHYGERVGSA